jgi:16S rRNA (uracil1498-N3)-methyltransferase
MVRGCVQEQGMRRFYFKNIQTPKVQIRGEEARHMLKVLRMKEGDSFILFDGSGTDYPCRIDSVANNELTATVGRGILNDREPSVRITLYQSMLKKDNLDLVLQKTTELGIERFIPVLSARCVRRPDDSEKLAVRLEKTAREAAKQCGRSKIPLIGKLMVLNEIQEYAKSHDLLLLAYENEKAPIKSKIYENDFMDIGIIIGPEGGFETEEVRGMEKAGAVVCGLGKLTLRAETAAIAAVSMIIYEKMESK